jgi:hypothetical protein
MMCPDLGCEPRLIHSRTGHFDHRILRWPPAFRVAPRALHIIDRGTDVLRPWRTGSARKSGNPSSARFIFSECLPRETVPQPRDIPDPVLSPPTISKTSVSDSDSTLQASPESLRHPQASRRQHGRRAPAHDPQQHSSECQRHDNAPKPQWSSVSRSYLHESPQAAFPATPPMQWCITISAVPADRGPPFAAITPSVARVTLISGDSNHSPAL